MTRWLAFGLVVKALALAGCQAPLAAPTAGVPVTARVAFGGYGLQAIVSAYTAADVDHVKLVLLTNDGGWRETGATRAVAKADLAAAVSLGHLRADRAYRVRVDAYRTAAESASSLISDTAASTTDFRTPAVVTTAGVASIDDAAVAVGTLRCKLRDRDYAGTATFTVAVNKGVAKKITHVRVTLKQVAADGTTPTRFTRTVTVAQAAGTFTVTNLRAATTYRLLAEGITPGTPEVKESTDAQSKLDFTTPTVAGGQVDDVVSASTLSVPCK